MLGKRFEKWKLNWIWRNLRIKSKGTVCVFPDLAAPFDPGRRTRPGHEPRSWRTLHKDDTNNQEGCHNNSSLLSSQLTPPKMCQPPKRCQTKEMGIPASKTLRPISDEYVFRQCRTGNRDSSDQAGIGCKSVLLTVSTRSLIKSNRAVFIYYTSVRGQCERCGGMFSSFINLWNLISITISPASSRVLRMVTVCSVILLRRSWALLHLYLGALNCNCNNYILHFIRSVS